MSRVLLGFQDELEKLAGDDWENLKYVLGHKWHILTGGREIGIPYGQLLAHDLSKLSPSEWGPYKRYWFGEEGGKDPTAKPAFRQAVETSHYPKNPHHPPHWGGVDLMPMKYKLEMLADWYSAGKTQGTHRFQSFSDWWAYNRDKLDISEELIAEIDKRLGR